MEFVTIHELSRMSGVSTATIRLDIKVGKIPVAAPGSRGRGNPARIRVADLEYTDRIQYQQLARRFLEEGPLSLTRNERDQEKFSVNELALRTGLSPQVVRKDIIDGKLKAEGGGRRGSPYYIFWENLADAARIEYRRLIENHRLTDADFLEGVKNEILLLKKEIQLIKERLNEFDNRLNGTPNSGDEFTNTVAQVSTSSNVQQTGIIQIPLASVILPAVFEGYYVSEDKVKHLKVRIQNEEPLDPIQVRLLENESYLLRRGIAQYHVAKELGLSTLPAYLESSEE